MGSVNQMSSAATAYHSITPPDNNFVINTQDFIYTFSYAFLYLTLCSTRNLIFRRKRIIKHLWIYYPDDEEWSTYSSLDEPPEDATTKEFDADEYGYSKVATDVPEIFDVFEE